MARRDRRAARSRRHRHQNQAAHAGMTVNLDDLEAINPDLRDCLAQELARLPGSRVVKRRGRLMFQGLNGFEIAADVLCAAKARWAELQLCGPFTDEQIW